MLGFNFMPTLFSYQLDAGGYTHNSLFHCLLDPSLLNLV